MKIKSNRTSKSNSKRKSSRSNTIKRKNEFMLIIVVIVIVNVLVIVVTVRQIISYCDSNSFARPYARVKPASIAASAQALHHSGQRQAFTQTSQSERAAPERSRKRTQRERRLGTSRRPCFQTGFRLFQTYSVPPSILLFWKFRSASSCIASVAQSLYQSERCNAVAAKALAARTTAHARKKREH